MYLPKSNAILTIPAGYSFRNELTGLVNERDLVITNLVSIKKFETKHSRRIITTLHRMHRVITTEYDRVVIDCDLPNHEAKLLKTLCKLCENKVVIFVNPVNRNPFKQIPSLAKIVIATGNPDVKVFDLSWDIIKLYWKRR